MPVNTLNICTHFLSVVDIFVIFLYYSNMITLRVYTFNEKVRKIKQYQLKIKQLQTAIYNDAADFVPIFTNWRLQHPECQTIHKAFNSFCQIMPECEWGLFRYYFAKQYKRTSKRVNNTVVRVYISNINHKNT